MALVENHLVAWAGDGLTEYFLRHALRVNICSVEEVYPGFQTDVHQASGLGDIRRTPRFEEFATTAESRGAKAKHRHLQSRTSKPFKFHNPRINDRGSARWLTWTGLRGVPLEQVTIPLAERSPCFIRTLEESEQCFFRLGLAAYIIVEIDKFAQGSVVAGLCRLDGCGLKALGAGAA